MATPAPRTTPARAGRAPAGRCATERRAPTATRARAARGAGAASARARATSERSAARAAPARYAACRAGRRAHAGEGRRSAPPLLTIACSASPDRGGPLRRPPPGQDKADQEHQRRRGNERASGEALRPVVQEHLVLTRGQHHAAREAVGPEYSLRDPVDPRAPARVERIGNDEDRRLRAGRAQAQRRGTIAEKAQALRRWPPGEPGDGSLHHGGPLRIDRAGPEQGKGGFLVGHRSGTRREVSARQALRV